MNVARVPQATSRLVVSVFAILIALSTSQFPAYSASRSPQRLPKLVMAVLDTGDTVTAWRAVPSWHRIIAEIAPSGQSIDRTTLLVIDTRHARIISRLLGMPMPTAVDDRSGRALVVPATYSASAPIVGWAINLQSGRARRLAARFSAMSTIYGNRMDAAYVDFRRGFALDVDQLGDQSGISLTVTTIPLKGNSSPRFTIPLYKGVPISGFPQTFADTWHNRLLIPTAAPFLSAQGGLTITALAANTLRIAWTRQIPYLPAATAFDSV